MDTWQSWVTMAVSAIVAVMIRSSYAEKKRRDDLDLVHGKRLNILEKELAILQKTALSDKEVRDIIREELHPMSDRIEKMESNIKLIADSITELKIAVVRDVYHNSQTK